MSRVITWLIRFFLFIAIVILLLYGTWIMPQLLQPPSESLPAGSKNLIEIQNEYRKIFVQIIGGIAILYGLYLTNRRTKAIEDRARSLENNVRVTEEGQITERFTRAVEQIGNEKLEVRLGGIYALERIAKDSKKDYWTIMEILTAFVRENSPTDLEENDKNEDYSQDISNDKEKSSKTKEKIRTDIQAILSVIGRRREWHKTIEPTYINLPATNLSSADLRGAYLCGANLGGSNLKGSDLDQADLSHAYLEESNLSEASLRKACLYKSELHQANLSKTYFWEADMREACLIDTNAQQVTFFKANLSGANLGAADLRGASFYDADLQNTDFWGANLLRTKGLTLKQLSEVKTLYEAKLDSKLKKEVKKNYPYLLAKLEEHE